jgi:hypothetical protein
MAKAHKSFRSVQWPRISVTQQIFCRASGQFIPTTFSYSDMNRYATQNKINAKTCNNKKIYGLLIAPPINWYLRITQELQKKTGSRLSSDVWNWSRTRHTLYTSSSRTLMLSSTMRNMHEITTLSRSISTFSFTHSLTQQRTRRVWAFLSNSVVKTNAKKRYRRKLTGFALLLHLFCIIMLGSAGKSICRAARTWRTIANKSRLVVRERCDLFP